VFGTLIGVVVALFVWVVQTSFDRFVSRKRRHHLPSSTTDTGGYQSSRLTRASRRKLN
jgi:hypothetical protein